MGRVTLIGWKGPEVEERAERLRRAGHAVQSLVPRGAADLRLLLADPPDAVVIDLERLPSQGCAVGVFLRQRRGTRSVPIVFAGGDARKVVRVRDLLPDAAYSEWNEVAGALRRAVARRPPRPIVPGTMDGYSGVPLARKLGIRPGAVVALGGAPRLFAQKLRPLPRDVRLRKGGRGGGDVVVLFARSRTALERSFAAAARALAAGGRLWIAWPKQASGVVTDLTATRVRAFGLRSGFVDYKICAIDETWSGLCFARRGHGGAAGRKK